MSKLRMHTVDQSKRNIGTIGQLFPNCLTERLNERGEVERAIDFDVLRQELSDVLVEGAEERYQFTWPDKRRSMLLANSPIAKTLRPCREESVDFDTTENLYIEGDNLDVLKLLQETYLGKVKMIYIDPPYNTGNDFVYEDDYAIGKDEFMDRSGMYDDEGNQLFDMRANNESNGRFHTDWLNMIYPRLKVAKDLLSDDGVIFISIDDNEIRNLKCVCDEVFGEVNFIACMIRQEKAGSGHDSKGLAVEYDYILSYSKNINECILNREIVNTEEDPKYRLSDEFVKERGRYYLRDLDYRGSYSTSLDYAIKTPDQKIIYAGGEKGKPNTWRWSESKYKWGLENGFIVFKGEKVYIKQYQYVDNNGESRERYLPYRSLTKFLNSEGTVELSSLGLSTVFSFPKSTNMLKYLLNIGSLNNSIILDFFSGSATTAHAVMQLNAEDGGNRKFIMVQLPEATDEKSEAHKAGYKNICEIGKERIRRAGLKVSALQAEKKTPISGAKADYLLGKTSQALEQNIGTILDTGFRVLKLDSTNMKDVYYHPEEYSAKLFDSLTDNIKNDRSPEDLLFQVMLELDVLLSSKIEEQTIDGKRVFSVNDGYLIACFDEHVAESTITAIAKQKPHYFVMRDSSMASDSVATNFDQLFETYSKDTIRRVL